MALENFIIGFCAVFGVVYFLIFEINWQWEGFDKIKRWIKKGCK